ncbi:hypothetical protein [Sessilibacter sp. MAH4]
MTWGSGYALGIGAALIFWFFLIRPMEKKYHSKKLRLIQQRIKEKELAQAKQSQETNNAD